MLIKKKIEILNKIKLVSIVQAKKMLRTTRYIELGKKWKYNGLVGSGHHTHYVVDDLKELLSEIMDIKASGNDAPRLGQYGAYYIFKDNVQNRENLYFIKKILEVVISDML